MINKSLSSRPLISSLKKLILIIADQMTRLRISMRRKKGIRRKVKSRTITIIMMERTHMLELTPMGDLEDQ
jgi:hypothetical protein